MSDHKLEEAVMTALAANVLVNADLIVVQVVDERATLRGTAGSLLQRAEAVRTARDVPGIDSVDDDLHVKLMGIDRQADADTEAAVLAALIADDEVHAADIEVHARAGDVTLSGLVELPAQRERAERIAGEVGGVSQVRNRIRIWLTVDADDVAARVTDAIGDDALIGIDEISVTVRDNDVTLIGRVTSGEHRDAAVEAAERSPGVVHVHDQLLLRERAS
ncbi:MAG TPA: BON domain-containing protein [Solirubrobacteraceae bacterium]|nr:BON domain-containing protein [Solirubrobacteraceae bacterium]